MKRYIENITILAELGETIELPKQVIAKAPDGNYLMIDVTWDSYTVDTSTIGEFIFVGTVQGYPENVLLSVHVTELDENPPSSFPEDIDEFGLPKRDIQTSDIPDIDDYQYFKAKIDRRPSENTLLIELRQLLADKIILARDINHMRNAIIEIEKLLLELMDRVASLEDRVTKTEGRLDDVEGEVDALAKLTSFTSTNGISIKNDGTNTVFSICDFIKFSNYPYFGMKMVNVRHGSDGASTPSLLWVLGVGSDDKFSESARILKGATHLVFEFKKLGGGFTGMTLGNDGFKTYDSLSSRINSMLAGEGTNAYSEWSKMPDSCEESGNQPPNVDTPPSTDPTELWKEDAFADLNRKLRTRGEYISERRFDDYIERGEMMFLIDALTQ